MTGLPQDKVASFPARDSVSWTMGVWFCCGSTPAFCNGQVVGLAPGTAVLPQ